MLLGIAGVHSENKCLALKVGVQKSASRAVCKKQSIERGILDRTLKESSLLSGTGGPEKWVSCVRRSIMGK